MTNLQVKWTPKVNKQLLSRILVRKIKAIAHIRSMTMRNVRTRRSAYGSNRHPEAAWGRRAGEVRRGMRPGPASPGERSTLKEIRPDD